ncbi:MAG: hypothetical protein HY673_01825 [Chloroflexi bacterium]|nr:hypothetical protein [Chloroflexota bacterium]
MIKVKSFQTPIQILKTTRQLAKLDDDVNKFIAENKVTSVISVSDAATTDDTGATIGLVRVVTYEEK